MAKKKNAEALIREAREKRQKFLLLGDCALTEIPESVCELVQLERLEAWGNQLKALPKNLVNLVHLAELELNRNEFKWPWDVCALVGLRKLGLADNKISEISPEISQLESLELLDLSFNQVVRLPEQLFALPNLQSLNLTHNKLKSIPAALLSRLTKLRELFLGDNKEMLTIPSHVLEHPSLETLWIDHSQYRALPAATLDRGRPEIQVL